MSQVKIQKDDFDPQIAAGLAREGFEVVVIDEHGGHCYTFDPAESLQGAVSQDDTRNWTRISVAIEQLGHLHAMSEKDGQQVTSIVEALVRIRKSLHHKAIFESPPSG
jgi:hypothetical protein